MSVVPPCQVLAQRAGDPEVVLFVVATLLALLCLWAALRAFRRRAALRAMPTTPVEGVFVGEVEVRGRARTPEPLTAPMSAVPVVMHMWTVEEHWTRTRTETYRDAKGNTHTRVVTYSGMDTVGEGSRAEPLFVDDGTGAILVRPDGAKIEYQCTFTKEVDRDDALYLAHAPEADVAGSDGVRTLTEHAIPVDAELFIVGYARERTDLPELEIASGGLKGAANAGARPRMFLISTRSEQAVIRGHSLGGYLWMAGAVLLVVGLGAVDFRHWEQTRQLSWTAAAAVGVLGLVWCAAWTVWTNNDLVDLRNRVRRARANVDVQLRRRHDLIEQLLGAVRGMRDHEATVQRAIAELRSQSALQDMAAAHARAVPVLPRVQMLAEAMPRLTASGAFLALQGTLSECERRIALARDEYNGTASGFNARIATFPVVLVASMRRMRPDAFFSAEAFERAAPSVPSPA